MTLLLQLHAASTLAMTGLIWFVQIVHYPAYRWVPASTFQEYQRQHTRRTGWVVMPLMLTELASSVSLVWLGHPLSWIGLALVVLVWACTFFIQVPLHHRLTLHRDEAAIEKLILSNVIRTALWPARALLALYWLS